MPQTFTKPLRDFITSTRSHIATLNYDELLYRSFVGTDVFRGFSCMIDGFLTAFSNDNLARKYPSSQCYYLHLHGSPLFHTMPDGETYKVAMSKLSAIAGHSSHHLVLTHVAHKTSVISASPVLMAYWNRLAEACQEAEGIVLVGYSGGDTHLNHLIKNYVGNKQLEVIERKHAEYSTDEGNRARFAYWDSLLGVTPLIWWHDNILSHTSWDYVKPPPVVTA